MSEEPAPRTEVDDPVELGMRSPDKIANSAEEPHSSDGQPADEAAMRESDSPDSAPGEEPDDRSATPEASKRSPAEAFAALGEAVGAMRLDLDDVYAFVRICREKLLRQAEEYRLEGLRDALHSLMRLHDLVWRQVTSMEAGNVKPDAFIVTLFQTIESELRTHEVEVIRPQPGDEVDLEIMTTIGTTKCPFWRKPDRVAEVLRCGFVRNSEAGRQILQRAEITVSRR